MMYNARKSVPSLSQVLFFQGVKEEVATLLDSFAWHRAFAPRQIIYFPDDACDYIYWVRSGRVKITRVADNGREIAFRHLIGGDMFGEECLIDRPKRADYAEAIIPTLLTLVRSDDFLRIVRTEVELCHAVARQLCHRALDVESSLSAFVFDDVRQRVVRCLWRYYRRESHGGSISLNVTHQEIANLVGAARETVTGVLHGLRNDGVIALANRRIRIVKPAKLQHLAESG